MTKKNKMEDWKKSMYAAVETEHAGKWKPFMRKTCQKGMVELQVCPWDRAYRVYHNAELVYHGDDFNKACDYL